MPATIKIKNSSTASAVPTSSDLVQGELAVNVTDKRIFTENASGTVVELGTNPTILTMGAAGSAAAPAITRTGDTDTGIFFPAANTLAFATNGTEDARFDASGNFGLGVTPAAWSASGVLQVSRASMYSSGGFTAFANNWYSNAGDKYIASDFATQYYQSSGQHVWRTAASGTAGNAITFTQAMTLDASGNLGVGNTSPSQKVSIGFTAGTVGYNIVYTGGGGGEVAAFTANGSTGEVRIGGTGSTYFPTFYSNGAERARIDTSGNLLVGTTTATGKRVAAVVGNTVSTSGYYIESGTGYTGAHFYGVSGTAAGTGWYHFVGQSSGGTNNILIYGNGNVQNANNSYGAISDIKLKENITDATPKLADLMQVQVRNYNLIGDTTKQIGVVAQELESVFPSLVEETADRDAEGNDLGTTTKSVKYSVFVPMLIKAIQELNAKVDAQAAEIAALKGNA
jgi:hypothetical protein